MTSFAMKSETAVSESRFARLLARLRSGERSQVLDLRQLPDHLKRDIGVLDGHETPYCRTNEDQLAQ